jgi:tetratricopeptide (TPR) repeat protein
VPLWEEAIRAFGDIGDENYALLASRFLAGTYDDLGHRRRAREMHEEHLRVARSTGNKEIEGDMLGTLGTYALEEGRVDEALPLLKEGLLIDRDLGNRLEVVLILRTFARALALAGRVEIAARLLSSSETLREEEAFRRTWFGEPGEEVLSPIRSQLDEATFVRAWEVGRKLTMDEAIALALDAIG